MDTVRFDHVTRIFSTVLSRRGVTSALGLAATGIPSLAEARKKKRKRLKRNAFGCVNVGKFCKNNGQCCSGICQGKKGKKNCKAHDPSTCQAGQMEDFCGGVTVDCTTSSGDAGECNTTTGKAGYCSNAGACLACSKDADCTEVCGAGAACIICTACDETGGLACVGLTAGSCGVMEV